MSTVQLLVGVLCLGVGTGMILTRERIVARQARLRGRAPMPASGVTVLAALLSLVGALQVVLAFA
jgi:hypothetical protein